MRKIVVEIINRYEYAFHILRERIPSYHQKELFKESLFIITILNTNHGQCPCMSASIPLHLLPTD